MLIDTAEKTRLGDARQAAENLRRALAPYCNQILIAGSVRRLKPAVKDIEIVVDPAVTYVDGGLFHAHEVSAVDQYLESLSHFRDTRFERIPAADGGKWGTRFKNFRWLTIKVDLFVVLPPAQWGVIAAIRTGPADYSQRFVTQQCRGGLLPDNMRVQQGQLWQGTEVIPTPTEESFFEAIGLPWREPWERE